VARRACRGVEPTRIPIPEASALFGTLHAAGIDLTLLAHEVEHLRVDDVAQQAFKESGFAEIEAYFPPAQERAAFLTRRAQVALRYSLAIAALSTGLTLIGVVAALWHMAWWIGSTLLAMVAFSAVSVVSGFFQ